MSNEPTIEAHDRFLQEVAEILKRVDSLPILDPRPADEIIGYDDYGVPG